MKVNLIYFKKSGKYYSDGNYDTKCAFLDEIIDEVFNMKVHCTLPGITGNDFIVLVDVDGMPNHLIL